MTPLSGSCLTPVSPGSSDSQEAGAAGPREEAAPLDSQASTMTGSALDYMPLQQMVSDN